MELKWVNDIIIGANEPNVSGYAIMEDGIVVSHPIPEEFNNIIAELLSRLSRGEKAILLLKELHSLVWGECPSLLVEDSGDLGRLDVEIYQLLRASGNVCCPLSSGSSEYCDKWQSDGMKRSDREITKV